MVQKQTREGIESTTRPLWVQAMVQASTMRRPKSRVYDDEPKPVDCEGSWDTLYHVTSDGEEAVFLDSNLWIRLKIHFQ